VLLAICARESLAGYVEDYSQYSGMFKDLRFADENMIEIRQEGTLPDGFPQEVAVIHPSDGTPDGDRVLYAWTVTTNFSSDRYGWMMFDFNLTGIDNPPPKPLNAHYWSLRNRRVIGQVIEFTNEYPTGSDTRFEAPFDHWVSETVQVQDDKWPKCPQHLDATFADVVDGDAFRVTIDNSTMTIKPHGNKEQWVLNTALDEHCRVMVDFQAAGKPHSRPGELLMTWFLQSCTGCEPLQKNVFQFTDPSETLASDTMPLNHWVQYCDTCPLSALLV
jgi:hypothetical protein